MVLRCHPGLGERSVQGTGQPKEKKTKLLRTPSCPYHSAVVSMHYGTACESTDCSRTRSPRDPKDTECGVGDLSRLVPQLATEDED